jgi:hypothetical protein
MVITYTRWQTSAEVLLKIHVFYDDMPFRLINGYLDCLGRKINAHCNRSNFCVTTTQQNVISQKTFIFCSDLF